MNIKALVSTVAVALALGAGGARAQSISGPSGGVAGASDGDLLLGFTNPTSTPSNGDDLVFDIGSASSYYSTSDGGSLTPGTPYTVSAFSLTDVTNQFGSGAASSGNVLFGVIGGNGNAGGPAGAAVDGVWAATPGSALGQSSAQSSLSIAIDGFTHSGVGGGGALSDNTDATLIPIGVGFENQATGAGNFGLFATSILGTFGTTTSLELYQLIEPTGRPGKPGYNPGASIDLGTFALSGSSLTFTPFEAIPEPSTYAAVLGALTIGFVLIRRRNRSTGLGALA